MIPGQVGRQLASIVPCQEILTMNIRTSSGGVDSFTTEQIPNARRRPLTRQDQLIVQANIGEHIEKFQIYDTGLTTYPIVGYQLVDSNNVVYEVRHCDSRSVQGVYNVICITDK